MKPDQQDVPLCVDLDGTLVRTNTLAETIVGVVRLKPSILWRIPFWALQGQARLWTELTHIFRPDASILPYSKPVADLIRKEAANGRTVVLATGAHESVARDVATQFGLFSAVLATRGGEHLTGKAKAEALVSRFGTRGFDYVGDSHTDMAVFRHCRMAYVASTSRSLPSRLKRESIPNVRISTHLESPGRSGLLAALRPRQWAKNLLVFLPVLLSHRFAEVGLLLNSALAFALMCMISSAAYIFNDIGDVEADRRHPDKRHRPFARGATSIRLAMPVAVVLAVSSIAAGWFVNPGVSLLLALYLAATTLYSVWLKKLLIVDMILLAAFYILRVFLGSAATGIRISAWTDLFCLFIFSGLAAVKRYAEVRNSAARSAGFIERRAYLPGDALPLMSIGTSCFVGAVIAFGLYLGSSEVRTLYRKPDLLWLACPILLGWACRLWILSHRGELHGEDPFAFSLGDRWSQVAALLAAAVFMLAI